ncbi:MAG TPA: alpha-L-fucosidase, partial [Gemmataceae bacterium]|nr:alpha-L-fucosidase [Gemmataceae bacterium]
KHFNPTKYDPEKWVRLAKQAGMKYIVITSKHHDGFCLFDTKTTDYNVVRATPYGKDLLKPLSEACKKAGLKFCVYYSILDWHHPSQYIDPDARRNAQDATHGHGKDRIHTEQKAEYIRYMKTQLKELITQYDPAVLWFDGEWQDWWTEDDGKDLYRYVRSLKPDIIVNNRVGKGRKGMEGLNKGAGYAGDFGTPEQQIPATGLPGVDWESCMTMNDTWGYKSFDHHWKSTKTLVRNLIDIASKGGNYLLNVGPMPTGELPEAIVERLEGIGRWMKVNGEAIHGTQASPFPAPAWGRYTRKKNRIYAEVFDWPPDGNLHIPATETTHARAYLLADRHHNLKVEAAPAGGLAIHLPRHAPDPIASVVVLEFAPR